MAILLQDNFTGTTIDTGKWTETDPNSRISQNDLLYITNTNSTNILEFVDKLQSVSFITSGTSVLQSKSTWSSGGGQEPIGGMYLYKDNSNFAYIGARSSGGTYRIRIYISGIQQYTFESSVANNKDVKIVNTGSAISFYYWNGSSWVQIGSTWNGSLGYNLYAVLSHQDLTSTTGATSISFDNLYFSNDDYTTQYPLSSNTSSFFQLF